MLDPRTISEHTAAPLVRLTDATIGYGAPLLTDVSLEIPRGDFLAVVGPNGGGKTTLLRTLLGVLRPLAGRRTQSESLRIGYVPQRDHVDPYWPLTVAEVVLMGRCRLLGPLQCTGIIPGFIDKLAGNGVHLPPQFFQTEQRAGGYGSFGRQAS